MIRTEIYFTDHKREMTHTHMTWTSMNMIPCDMTDYKHLLAFRCASFFGYRAFKRQFINIFSHLKFFTEEGFLKEYVNQYSILKRS